MMDGSYEYLSGSATIPATAPEQWKKGEIHEFYARPNDQEWGEKLCRVLFHESLHFWQFLSSGYIASLVAEDWEHLVHFEKKGEIKPYSEKLKNFRVKQNFAFSSYNLVECIARYWDVHTRNANKIIEKEKIEIDKNKVYAADMGLSTPVYTEHAFDTVMQFGEDCQLYAEPYRWMLKQSKNDSYFTNSVFPAIASFAFLTEKPVEVFCESFSMALKSNKLKKKLNDVGRKSRMQIHAAWYESYHDVLEIVSETVNYMSLPKLKLGIDIIGEQLQSHPIFKEFPTKITNMLGNIKFDSVTVTLPPYSQHILQMAISDLHVVFTFFGEPDFRYYLGRALHPPKIIFQNFTIFANRPVQTKLAKFFNSTTKGDDYGDNYEKHYVELEDRIKNFRNAQAKDAYEISKDHLKK